ncbi:MAG: RNA polymerase sigma factor [Phycisphaerales bacterium JB038]
MSNDSLAEPMNTARERTLNELLVVRCQAGDQRDFELLARRWHRRLWLHARRITGRDETASEVMQETWLAILAGIQRLQDPAWFPAWAHRIVRHKAADLSRRACRRRRLVAGQAAQLEAPDKGRETRADEVRAALQRLAPEAREILQLRYGSGLTMVEMAVALELPVGTVKSRLHAARQQIRQTMQGVDQ